MNELSCIDKYIIIMLKKKILRKMRKIYEMNKFEPCL